MENAHIHTPTPISTTINVAAANAIKSSFIKFSTHFFFVFFFLFWCCKCIERKFLNQNRNGNAIHQKDEANKIEKSRLDLFSRLSDSVLWICMAKKDYELKNLFWLYFF